MASSRRRSFRAILSSADVTTAASIPLYLAGDDSPYSAGVDERLDITNVTVVHAAGGDVHVFAAPTNTPVTGGTIARGTVAANGGLAVNFVYEPWMGVDGWDLWIISDTAGQVDVVITGGTRDH